jgi:hypothetical protein
MDGTVSVSRGSYEMMTTMIILERRMMMCRRPPLERRMMLTWTRTPLRGPS